MKKAVLAILFTTALCMVVCSCVTGFSKSTYISSLDKYVSQLEENWKSFDEDDWTKVDERMKAFDLKYEKYSEDFTKEELKELAKIMGRYAYVRAKSTGKSWLKSVKDMFEDNKDLFDDMFDGLKNIGNTISGYADSINSFITE